ncbi:hypothetical protein ABZ922_31260 [Streptomyces shenzhenensis]
MTEHSLTLLRPTYHNLSPRPREHPLKPIRQLIEPVNNTLKHQLDHDHHGTRTPAGILTRIGQRIPAMTATNWHNHNNRPTHHTNTHHLQSPTKSSALLIVSE